MTPPPVPTAPDRIPDRLVAWVLVAVIAGIAACALAIALLLLPALDDHARAAAPPVPPTATPPQPFSARTDVERTRALRRAALDRWSWADRDRGIVRLPVDVAIDRYLRQRGVP